MEKREIEINGQKVLIMEQPASFVLNLEKKFGDFDLIAYAKEILKYPSGINKKLDELISIPTEIKVDNHILKLPENKEEALYEMSTFFKALNRNGLNVNTAFIGELFLNKLNLKIDDFKYKEIEKMGAEVFLQVKEIAYINLIVNTFREL